MSYTSLMRGPVVVVYTVALAAAIVLDIVTPLSIADWLIEVIIVWIASVRGSSREMILVASAGTVGIALGLWTSPDLTEPMWVAIMNRSVAVGVIWMIVVVGYKRSGAENARSQAAAQLRILEGLLPICAGCKDIRDGAGEWHRLESYLSTHSSVTFTHSLCPPCAEQYRADLYEDAKH
jgi:hypothetical protein